MKKVIKLFFLFGIAISFWACENNATAKSTAENEKQALQEKPKDVANAVTDEASDEGVAENASEQEAIESEAVSLQEEKEIVAAEKVSKENVEKPKKKKSKPSNSSKITFEKTTYNFGTVDEGELIAYQFFFKNTGKKNLLIKNATATCGCTVPSYPKVPIEPEEESYIRISFNTKAKKGAQKPVVKVFTNARKAPYELYLEGNVTPKAEEGEPETKEEDGK